MGGFFFELMSLINNLILCGAVVALVVLGLDSWISTRCVYCRHPKAHHDRTTALADGGWWGCTKCPCSAKANQ